MLVFVLIHATHHADKLMHVTSNFTRVAIYHRPTDEIFKTLFFKATYKKLHSLSAQIVEPPRDR